MYDIFVAFFIVITNKNILIFVTRLNFNMLYRYFLFDLIFGVLMPLLSTAFRLFCDDQFLLLEEAEVPGENH